jgi:predicted rRNA methylase YqxC with S4 and FtsJ domains
MVQIEKLPRLLLQMKNFLFKIKEEGAAELIINKELTFQNKEKRKPAAELVVNTELALQNEEKKIGS